MTIGGSGYPRCGHKATFREKPCQASRYSLCKSCFAFGPIPLDAGISGSVEGCRSDGRKSAEAAAGYPNERAFARVFKRLPYQGFCGLEIGMQFVGPPPFEMRAGAGHWRRMRPSTGDEDRLRRLIWCAMPEICTKGRPIARYDAMLSLVLPFSGATPRAAFAAADIQLPNHNSSYADAARRAFKRPVRAPEALRSRPKRVQHAQQDDYRRFAPGRDPGSRIKR